jgi:hypothetical protein
MSLGLDIMLLLLLLLLLLRVCAVHVQKQADRRTKLTVVVVVGGGGGSGRSGAVDGASGVALCIARTWTLRVCNTARRDCGAGASTAGDRQAQGGRRRTRPACAPPRLCQRAHLEQSVRAARGEEEEGGLEEGARDQDRQEQGRQGITPLVASTRIDACYNSLLGLMYPHSLRVRQLTPGAFAGEGICNEDPILT